MLQFSEYLYAEEESPAFVHMPEVHEKHMHKLVSVDIY